MSKMLEATTEFLSRITTMMNEEATAISKLSVIMGGWEKWLQGHIILCLDGVETFNLAQEDKIFNNSKESVDFAFALLDAGSRRNPDICIVELKSITQNQRGAPQKFYKAVKEDIEKLTGQVKLETNHTCSARMMLAVTIPNVDFNAVTLEGFDEIIREVEGKPVFSANGMDIGDDENPPSMFHRAEYVCGGEFILHSWIWLQMNYKPIQ